MKWFVVLYKIMFFQWDDLTENLSRNFYYLRRLRPPASTSKCLELMADSWTGSASLKKRVTKLNSRIGVSYERKCCATLRSLTFDVFTHAPNVDFSTVAIRFALSVCLSIWPFFCQPPPIFYTFLLLPFCGNHRHNDTIIIIKRRGYLPKRPGGKRQHEWKVKKWKKGMH